MLDTGSLEAALANGTLNIYAGTVPATADDAIGGATLLLTIDNTTGINMETTAVGGVLTKLASETWTGTVASTGTAAFYRHVASGDTGVSSTTEKRIQGTIATAGGDMNFTEGLTLTATNAKTIDYYAVALPTL
jgi:hypothetical protein